MFNAPYYTIVKAAGNDRGDSGPGPQPRDGPYDCIPTFGNAKNIVTVGSVNKMAGSYAGPSSVSMSSFSSWGPTDDGRIKPDLVAPGVALFSASAGSDYDYATFSGTSMATACVTGSLTLLQQLYHRLHKNYLRSSTLKAIVIHSARETGPTQGPDYMFGWGLLNMEAASTILLEEDAENIKVIDSVLADHQIIEIPIFPKANTKITATIAWTDPPGISPLQFNGTD